MWVATLSIHMIVVAEVAFSLSQELPSTVPTTTARTVRHSHAILYPTVYNGCDSSAHNRQIGTSFESSDDEQLSCTKGILFQDA